MKNQFKLLLSSLVLLSGAVSAAQNQDQNQDQNQAQKKVVVRDKMFGGSMQSVAVFKKPLRIPFESLKSESDVEKLRSDIEQSGGSRRDVLLTLTIMDGDVVRATDFYSRLNDKVRDDLDLVSKRRELSMPMGESDEDLSYCIVTINASGLERDDKNRQFLFQPQKETIPFREPFSTPKFVKVHPATFTEQPFGMFRELAPHERPSPITHVGRSQEIPLFTCYRFATGNSGLREKDFIQIFGADNIELRNK